jgi:NADPH-dependent ferric siderophore reductase
MLVASDVFDAQVLEHPEEVQFEWLAAERKTKSYSASSQKLEDLKTQFKFLFTCERGKATVVSG